MGGMGALAGEGCLRGTSVNCVHAQGQESLSFRDYNLPPGQSLSGFSWSVVAFAVVPHGTPKITGDFSELGTRKGRLIFA